MLADDDAAGWGGAAKLAAALVPHVPVRVAVPPVGEDARGWLGLGATAADVAALFAAAEPRTLAVRLVAKGVR